GQESNLLARELPFTVEDLPRQLVLLKNPRVANVQIWRDGEHAADDRNAIFDVQHALSITADVNDVIERPRNGVACFRIGHIHIAHDERARTDGAEVEAADIEVATHEESLVVGDSRAAKAINK